MSSEIRKLSMGGENPFDNKCHHYQVGTVFAGGKYQITRITKDGKLFHEKGISQYAVFVLNTETREEFVWKRPCVGSATNHWEEYELDFE